MKYIDTDRLRTEIEKHIKEVKDAAERFTPNLGFFDAKLSGIYDVMAIINSLQQEHPVLPDNLDEAAEDSWALYEYRESPRGLYSTCYVDGFKAGAEWMARQMKQEQPVEKQKEQKPAEWSEEDEDMLNSCISSIEEAKENRYAYKETDGDTSYDHEIAWLKLLRNRVGKEFLQPHWKPSEEQKRK